jgi:enoyl-[acyl-carrier protein] reductase III
MELEGKTALITGSSRGIGKGIALALAESGVKVAVHYFQNEGAAKETLEQIRKRGSDGFVVQADVMHPNQITDMFQKVKAQFGQLDIFVATPDRRRPHFFSHPSTLPWNSGTQHSIHRRKRSSLVSGRRFR